MQAGIAQGMGLGNIDVQSYLGSPLQAHIGLLSPGEFETSELRVSLAQVDVYNRFKARYEASHGDIQFDVVTNDAGQKQILVRSSKRIVEPFLDIVVELSWPTGTTYRRYNLLLDPPNYAARWRAPQPEVDAGLTQAVLKSEPVPPVSTQTDIALDGTYQVQAGDSLWKVARKFRSLTGLSIQETMDVLYQNNPQAFVRGDRNLIKLGANLSVPVGRPAEVNETPRLDQVASQSYQSAAPEVSFTPDTPVSEVQVVPVPKAPEVTDTAEQVEQLKAQLAALKAERAELASFQQQVRSEMARLAAEREQMQETIALARELKQEVKQEMQAGITPQTPVVEPERSRMVVAQDLIDTGSQNPNQVIEKSGSGFWYLLGLVPMGLLIGYLGLRSRRVQEIKETEVIRDEDLYDLVFGSKRDRSKSDSPDQVEKAIHQIKEKASHRPSLQQVSQEEEDASRDDVSQMIELYLLYNQYQKALGVIHAEIAKRPMRKDLRLYLMQVYAKTRDWDAFDEQMEVLHRIGDRELVDAAEQLRLDYELEPLQRDAS